MAIDRPDVLDPSTVDPDVMYAFPGTLVDDIFSQIHLKRDDYQQFAIEDIPLNISLIAGGAPQLPGRTIIITGACEIDVSDLGDYGYGVRISQESGNIPIALSWNPTAGNALVYRRSGSTLATANYASYWSYDASTHKFTYNGTTSSNYDMRGTWQLIPYTP